MNLLFSPAQRWKRPRHLAIARRRASYLWAYYQPTEEKISMMIYKICIREILASVWSSYFMLCCLNNAGIFMQILCTTAPLKTAKPIWLCVEKKEQGTQAFPGGFNFMEWFLVALLSNNVWLWTWRIRIQNPALRVCTVKKQNGTNDNQPGLFIINT